MNESIIGVPQRRIDGRLKVSGTAHYAADHPMPGLLYAYGVYSTIARGQIRAIDDAKALKMPGVVCIVHHLNCPKLHRTPATPMDMKKILNASKVDEFRTPFEDDRVAYPGQFVALVLAESIEQARAAAYQVSVDYDVVEPITSLTEGLRWYGALSRETGIELPSRHLGLPSSNCA